MSKPEKTLPSVGLFLLVTAMISLCSVVLFTAIVPFTIVDLTPQSTANIGTTIGGIVTPVLSAISIYYLLGAFRKQSETVRMQMENNKDQRIKSDVDIVFMLLNQLDMEYNQFEYKEMSSKIGGTSTTVFDGYEGFLTYGSALLHLSKFSDPLTRFKRDIESGKILYIVTSYSLIKQHVLNSNLSGTVQSLLLKKLNLFYKAKFEYPMKFIIAALASHAYDPVVAELIKVHKSETSQTEA